MLIKEQLYKFQSMKVTDLDFECTLRAMWKDMTQHNKKEEMDLVELEDTIVPKACGDNVTLAAYLYEAVLFMDKACMSFKTSCTCTPKAGSEIKDLSFEAFNKTFTLMPCGMCGNLQWTKNTTHPGIVSGDYKPDGKRPTFAAPQAHQLRFRHPTPPLHPVMK
ncbi:hypothetical protein BG000_010519 [Podila horticola]|nr:hypothetical protein BG000_010519 [Podila horticola]